MENSLKYANNIGWSDINPHEIVRLVSEKTIDIRKMDAEELSSKCDKSNDQNWHIYSNVANPIFRIRLGQKGWKDSEKRHYTLSEKPTKYHDYNF